MDFKPFKVEVEMLGTNPLNDEALFTELLDVIESYPEFAPQFWSLEERGKLPYNRDNILDKIKTVEFGSYAHIYLKRNKAAKLVGKISVAPKQYIKFKFDPKMNSKHYPALFEFADRLVQVFKPDVASVHIDTPVYPRPFESSEHKNSRVVSSTASLAPVDYFKVGPKGLAMRTYLGPHYVKQFGQELLLSTPKAQTELQSWGSIRLDLSEAPWELTEHALIEHWQTAMAHLRPAKVFADLDVYQNRKFKYTKAENCTIGGLNYV
ncbi:hypothetical protein I6F65_00400 [Pseudoalteromonas sp. SWXJZ94C]|uniref:hypothetical protein n=1 Tax=Pseudoalteromonas sp. SWXJZ94C TaxID=2792065 RepID=UPI0018CEA5D8|nr:hypothetical protein [Pseudoalteromonas sp. SWXJZ94C]MBH0055415.1 hypothetical protein [Pseudoalteromonas sp. SWXJZ94C]